APAIAEPLDQRAKLAIATVNVANDIERAVIAAAIGVQRIALDRGRFDLLDRGQCMDAAKSLASQAAQGLAQPPRLTAHHRGAKIPIGAVAVAGDADFI